MADIEKIKAELTAPGTHGINNVTRTYTNPGGAPRDDNLAAVEANHLLLTQRDVEVYRSEINPEEVFTTYTAAALQGLSAAERDDYQAFVVPMLANGPIRKPETLLKDLIDTVVFSGAGENATVRTNYESLIRELQSVAFIIAAGNVRAGDVETAMLELGWIV